LSLVDCVSFEVLRRLDVRECLVFDPHFDEQGFTLPGFG
jgi:predicted nucleic acid-binding protein